MIDSLDRQLIELLMQDARRSSEVLAAQLDVSSSTVRRRVKRLTDEGIVHIVALPEPGKIGLFVEAIMTVNVSHERIHSVIEVLREYSQVRMAAVTSGRFDIMAYVAFQSTEELYRFIEDKIRGLERVTGSETFICLHVEKRQWLPA